MRLRHLAAVGVAILSFVGAAYLPIDEALRSLLAIPGVAGLVAYLGMLLRDEFAYQRQRDLQAQAEANELSVASHMAEKTFDKHADFVEEYVSKMYEALADLNANGATPAALRFADELGDIRRRYAAWLTQDIEVALHPFEHEGLRTIGAKAQLYQHPGALPVGEKRTQIVQEVMESFMVIVGLRKANDEQKAMAASTILQHLRDILGVGELTTLRRRALDRALKTSAKSEDG